MINSNQLVKWRREFHQYPESGWTEFVTTAKVVTVLRELGYEVKLGPEIINRDFIQGRNQQEVAESLKAAYQKVDAALLDEMDELPGCVAILDTGKPGPTFGFRFDIDCVQVSESDSADHIPTKEGFASCRPGLMHSCGHDGHTAIGLGVATWLMENRDKLSGKYKLVFQPAEEGVRGARPITESGILNDVDYFQALHIGAGVESGEVSLNPKGFQCSTKMDFYFYGEPAHAGAEPQKGRNALAGACNAAMLMLATPRHSGGTSRINVGKISAGEGRNIIPAQGHLQVEVRGQTQEINDYLAEHVTRCAQSSALAYELEMKKEIMGEAIDLINSPEMIAIVEEVARGIPHLTICPETSCTGSEDATIMIRRVQDRGGKAIYYIVGSALPQGHHKTKFDFEEKVLTTGVELMTGTVLKILAA